MLRQVVRIKKIFPTGPAASQGELREGDVILEVNDVMTRGLKHQEVMNLLRTAPDTVTLLICRPSDMDLPKIQSVTNELAVLGTTSPTPVVNIDSLEGPATYSDVDDMTSVRGSICSQSISIPPPHDNGSVRDQSYHDASVTSQTEAEEEGEEDERNERSQDSSDPDTTLNKSIRSIKESSSHTPSPVTQFLHDAGLSDADESVAARTPSVDHSEKHTDDDDHEEDDASDEDYDNREYEITLHKGEKGLGFTVAGSHHIEGYFYVKDVLYDPAVSCGHIESGHRLLVVDGQDMTSLTHRDAVAYLRQTPSTVTLRFYVPTPAERATAEAKASPKNFKDNFKDGDQPQSTSTPRQSMDSALNTSKTEVSLPKPLSQSTPRDSKHSSVSQKKLNLNVSNNSSGNTADDTADSETIEGGQSTASSFGNMSIPMPGEERDTHSSRSQPGEDRDTPSARSQRSDERSTPSIESGILRVTLVRKDQGYGFSLIHGERGVTSALFVRTITPGGAADEDGQVLVGDRLLQVNGESVIGMAHNKAVTLIKNSKDCVQLTLTRSTPSSTPTPVQELEQSTPESAHKFPQPTRDSNHSPIHTAANSSPNQSKEEETPESRLSREGQLAFLRLVENQKARRSESESSDGWEGEESGAEEGDTEEDAVPPEKPPRKKQFSRLPSEISNTWLETLPLVRPPADTVHYTGRQLQTTIKQLRAKLSSDEHLDEYKVLKHAKLTDNCLEARKKENKGKNRYRNVLPYDTNRVTLNGPDDYINASRVATMVGQARHSYIASQGPLPHTTGDFWRMVWEQRVEVIAMVTKDIEDNKVKCHKYWPDSVSEPFIVCDRYEISLVQTHHLQHFDIHHIKMEDRKTGGVHRVIHTAFSTWPDQGVPESTIPLLRYIQFVRLMHQSGPMLVHCSAGIGRTGVLITIDVILAMIDKDLKYDVQKIVQDLRRQRQGMIQVKDQYRFCYLAILEALESLSR